MYTVVPEPPAISRTLANLPALTKSAVLFREKEFATGNHMLDWPEQIPADQAPTTTHTTTTHPARAIVQHRAFHDGFLEWLHSNNSAGRGAG